VITLVYLEILLVTHMRCFSSFLPLSSRHPHHLSSPFSLVALPVIIILHHVILQVIKGAVPSKRTKEERRQLAAAKGSLEAAQLVSTAEATPEDLENDRLMSEADLEDSDADSDLEVEREGSSSSKGGNNNNNNKAKRGANGGSALAKMEIGEGDHDEFTEVQFI